MLGGVGFRAVEAIIKEVGEDGEWWTQDCCDCDCDQ
ncbi:uncharacterized protein G2W53_038081 [Senna tora]|uniref:Uncharacterized protein n=1 Tax=Senna tora TaxID=362788 RepID=A0A834SNJ4_9FABA|nr:uncharacterized protein G2W53_038081 [Senna tora]